MSLIKSKNGNRLLPWSNDNLNDFLDEDSLMPAMNIKEHNQDFEIEFAAPGFSKKDFEITIVNNTLNVCGEKQKETEDKVKGYTRKEFNYNSFKRSLNLPQLVNTDQDVKAIYKNGILRLKLQKKEAAEAKQKPKKVIKII
jgi:HSP20 family protein